MLCRTLTRLGSNERARDSVSKFKVRTREAAPDAEKYFLLFIFYLLRCVRCEACDDMYVLANGFLRQLNLSSLGLYAVGFYQPWQVLEQTVV